MKGVPHFPAFRPPHEGVFHMLIGCLIIVKSLLLKVMNLFVYGFASTVEVIHH